VQENDFEKVSHERETQSILRPSLSYWQDAWRRLKINKRAIVSLWAVILLMAFSFVGPYIWTVSPSEQDLDLTSKGPFLGKEALVIADYEPWHHESERYVDPSLREAAELQSPENLKVFGVPSTQVVRIQWDAVLASDGYSVYRSESRPENINELGLPIGETNSFYKVSYEDRLKLSAKKYYYSIVPVEGFNEGDVFSTLEVDVKQAIVLTEALKINSHIKSGEILELKARPMGTDYLGRDMLSRLMAGGRVSLFIGLLAPLLYVLIGMLYGGMAGFLGGKIDILLMRFADFVVGLPFLLMMILFRIVSGVGPGESGIMPMLMALVLFSWPSTARLVRGQVLQLKEEAYVQASRLLGAKSFYLVFRHLLPNLMGVIIVNLTISIPYAIFTEAFLSFIGMGVVPPTPSWGSMCNEGMKTLLSHPHELLFPALMISVTTLAFNLLGDGLRDALDARMRSRE